MKKYKKWRFEKKIIVLKNVLQPHPHLVLSWDLLKEASGARKIDVKKRPFFAVLAVISWPVPPAGQLISLGGRAWPPNPLLDLWYPENKMWFYTGYFSPCMSPKPFCVAGYTCILVH